VGAFYQGTQTPYQSVNAGVIPATVYGIGINFFVNRTPLYSRLPRLPLGALSFKVTKDNFRPRSVLLNNGGNVLAGDTTITVADGSSFLPGDVGELDSETVLITSVSGNALTVTRGYAGTTAAGHTDSTTTLYLIGNTRTGSETEQKPINRIPSTVSQDAQTFQHPYSIGGSTESATALALPPGIASAVGKARFDAMQNCADDIESSMYYGRGVTLSADTTKPAMKGLRSLLTTNNTTSPSNASTYHAADFIRDTIQACFKNGGNPDVALMSTDWMQGIATWGASVQRIDAGRNVFGMPIDVFECSWLQGIALVPAPLLRAGSAIVLTSSEVRYREKRMMYDKARGSRGDADEGDIIAEGAIEVDNEQHHAYLTGVTGWA
jgi:hypothetical protein